MQTTDALTTLLREAAEHRDFPSVKNAEALAVLILDRADRPMRVSDVAEQACAYWENVQGAPIPPEKTQTARRYVRYALANLFRDEGVVDRLKHGWYQLGDAEGAARLILESPDRGDDQAAHEGSDEDALDTDAPLSADITVWEVVGSGAHSLYVFCYPADRELAGLRGEDSWPVKIGFTRLRAEQRVRQMLRDEATQTALPHFPEILLEVRHDDAAHIERFAHRLLQASGRSHEGGLGREWFIASPTIVKEIVHSWDEAVRAVLQPAVSPAVVQAA